MSVHLLGVRHHGPGSARSVVAALEALQPDLVLVEGPPEADDLVAFVGQPDLTPPVALLVYAPEDATRASFYPFATFSPEWQALLYSQRHGIPARFIDLRVALRFALPVPAPPEETAEAGESPDVSTDTSASRLKDVQRDPLGALATAAGYADGERWWEHQVEQRREPGDVFVAIQEAMTALRDAAGPGDDEQDLREAAMRTAIRAAEAEGHKRIVVICGAWHVPALAEAARTGSARADAARLRGLARVKVAATWIPWTHARLTRASGYGAGVTAPGWYAHLFATRDDVAVRWMTQAARLLRDQDLDASSASVIEAVRLAEALAALRDRPLPDLTELTEAAQAVLGHGQTTALNVIASDWIVGRDIGQVPETVPAVPLQQDLTRAQKRLRLPMQAAHRDVDLDLRQPTDLARSQLLHRLRLLNVPWGKRQKAGRQRGTFHELWRVQWQPEWSVRVIEAARFGSTVAEAATACVLEQSRQASLSELTARLDDVLLADLPEASRGLVARIQNEAAVSTDVGLLMEALPPLAAIVRYGDVRQTDAGMVQGVLDGLRARICVGLPAACASLDDDAAAAMTARLAGVHDALRRLDQPEALDGWRAALLKLMEENDPTRPALHGLIAGRIGRWMLDAGVWSAEEVGRRMRLALTPAAPLDRAAHWLEGLLAHSGQLVLHQDVLWQALDAWITGLSPDAFVQMLPLARRTFATFSESERRQIGERVVEDAVRSRRPAIVAELDVARANAVLPTLARLLGVTDVDFS